MNMETAMNLLYMICLTAIFYVGVTLAQRRQDEDWKRRGTGGPVKSPKPTPPEPEWHKKERAGTQMDTGPQCLGDQSGSREAQKNFTQTPQGKM